MTIHLVLMIISMILQFVKIFEALAMILPKEIYARKPTYGKICTLDVLPAVTSVFRTAFSFQENGVNLFLFIL